MLAGRRAMTTQGDYDDVARTKAANMFELNFDEESVEAQDVSFVTNDNDDGQVSGQARVTIPTSVMHIFGYETVDLAADCMAELQLANADVMFVLDTTGSMGGAPIQGLRDAVRDFHAVIAAGITDEDTRIRYGFVPYSMTVNARGLIASGEMPTDFFVDEGLYQPKEALFNTPVFVGTTEDQGTVNETYGSAISSRNCDDWADNDYPSSGSNPRTSGNAPGNVTTRIYDHVSWTLTGTTGSGRNRVRVGTCVRSVQTTLTTYDARFRFTRWRPLWADAVFSRGNNADGWETNTNNGSVNENCPSEMMLFRDVDFSGGANVPDWLDTYLDNLVARGNTYHDIGMIWGGRLGSPRGIVADNVNADSGRPVSRHLIFMTDGEMMPTTTGYSAYGIERYDGRIGVAGSSLTTLHNRRFLAACAAARAQGYTIWVIGFGTAITDELEECASDGRAFFADDADELRNTFRFIGSSVADLRLNQ